MSLSLKSLNLLYSLEHEIGKGSQSHVYNSICKTTGNNVAIKQFKANSLNKKVIDLEIENLYLLTFPTHHPNIIHYIDSFTDIDDGHHYLVTNLFIGENLKTYTKPLRWMVYDYFDILYNLLLDLIKALEFIHSHNIIHGDIKYSNIQIVTGPKPILLDFGFSCNPNNYPYKDIMGTPKYMAPELWKCFLKNDRYNIGEYISFANDIWSLGICFYECVEVNPIWPIEKDLSKLGSFIIKKTFKLDTFHDGLNTLLSNMLIPDPLVRSSASQLLNN